MSQLSSENRTALLLHVHKAIDDYANHTIGQLQKNQLDDLINYPPNGGLTEAEKATLRKLANDETLRIALYKILAGNAGEVVFNLLNLIDGTSDPEVGNDQWTGVMLVDLPEDDDEDREMLHDSFFDTYLDYRR